MTRGARATLRRVREETITLRATTGAGVREVYWFVGESFVGKTSAGETLAWHPETSGEFVVRAVDDQGQADSRKIEVAVVQ